MIAAPTPADEPERLAELQALGLLDTPPEERFDRITRLLALVLRVPMAYISLIDSDRQWFKSSCGMGLKQTPRSISFCGHAILSDEPLIVADAREDNRFRDNPLVTGEEGVRFYAGRPLCGPGGHKVGTLCVADHCPRSPRPEEIEILEEMARLVERELSLVEVARLQRDLIASQMTLTRELNGAAQYVRSLLPGRLEGEIRTRWVFEPCSKLGGDSFGYEWIDPDHFAIYLLDVAGHGVGSALLSVSVANVLRSRSLPYTNFRDPSSVLGGLNEAFPMESQDGKYFTIWYGVFDRNNRNLAYASAGHPPAYLINDTGESSELGTSNFGIGMVDETTFESASVALGRSSRLYVFSDGAYEVRKPDGAMMHRRQLLSYLDTCPDPEDVRRFVLEIGQTRSLADDLSILEVRIS